MAGDAEICVGFVSNILHKLLLYLWRETMKICVQLVNNMLHKLLLDLGRGDDEICVGLVSYILPELLLNPGRNDDEICVRLVSNVQRNWLWGLVTDDAPVPKTSCQYFGLISPKMITKVQSAAMISD